MTGLAPALQTIYGRLEIVRRADREHLVEEGLCVVVAAPEDILRSKRASGRAKDIAALPQMRRDFQDSGALPADPQ